jgi:hypothetical protein
MNGTEGNGRFPETDRGTSPATPVSPDSPATKERPYAERQAAGPTGLPLRDAVVRELTIPRALQPAPIEEDEDAGAEAEIELTYRRKIAALRHMPRRDRPYLARAAREQRMRDLQALREKRAWTRHARHMLRRLKAAAPS